MDLNRYLDEHTFVLSKVGLDQKTYVQSAKNEVIKLEDYSDIKKSTLVLKFPGLVYSNFDFLSEYLLTVFDSYKDSFTPPRGYIDKSSVIIIGIAPGWSDKSFGEPNWLYGPSSRLLHEMLSFDHKWYITNVVKDPFFRNVYDSELVDKFYERLVQELSFFKNQKVIFLGKYEVYDKIISKLKLNAIRVRHPSFYCRRGNKDLELQKEDIRNFCRGL